MLGVYACACVYAHNQQSSGRGAQEAIDLEAHQKKSNQRLHDRRPLFCVLRSEKNAKPLSMLGAKGYILYQNQLQYDAVIPSI